MKVTWRGILKNKIGRYHTLNEYVATSVGADDCTTGI
jgi:hypothetical protein